jgi:hypothetical protein
METNFLLILLLVNGLLYAEDLGSFMPMPPGDFCPAPGWEQGAQTDFLLAVQKYGVTMLNMGLQSFFWFKAVSNNLMPSNNLIPFAQFNLAIFVVLFCKRPCSMLLAKDDASGSMGLAFDSATKT